MTISPEQCRAARILLKWMQPDLAKSAGTALSTIADFERGARAPHAKNLAAIRAALEAAGIVFIDSDDTMGPGVRLRDPQKK
jgi:transcriptional regulator with XRE-family HTH domain